MGKWGRSVKMDSSAVNSVSCSELTSKRPALSIRTPGHKQKVDMEEGPSIPNLSRLRALRRDCSGFHRKKERKRSQITFSPTVCECQAPRNDLSYIIIPFTALLPDWISSLRATQPYPEACDRDSLIDPASGRRPPHRQQDRL